VAIAEAAATAGSLTQQLLALSKRRVPECSIVSLNDIVFNGESVMRGLLGENCSLHIECCETDYLFEADPNQIQQILINLTVNAKEAMPDGGSLFVKTFAHSVDPVANDTDEQLSEGTYVVLEVRDTGVGLEENAARHLFEPFFSTKPDGVGLGLSTVNDIVTQHRGELQVSSKRGNGSIFKLFFPVSDGRLQKTKNSNSEMETFCGSETILVVEDEPTVRTLIHEVFSNSGYSVLLAACGEEALRLLNGSGASRIDLLLTDIMMPGISGFEFAEQVIECFPQYECRVLMMSGCTQDPTLTENIVKKGFPFIAKPFEPIELLRKVRSLLDDAERPVLAVNSS
jgi:CheY-like chemotaxis protein